MSVVTKFSLLGSIYALPLSFLADGLNRDSRSGGDGGASSDLIRGGRGGWSPSQEVAKRRSTVTTYPGTCLLCIQSLSLSVGPGGISYWVCRARQNLSTYGTHLTLGPALKAVKCNRVIVKCNSVVPHHAYFLCVLSETRMGWMKALKLIFLSLWNSIFPHETWFQNAELKLVF